MPRFALEILIIFLLIVWIVGAFLSPFGGNLIHVALALALLAVVIRLSRGRQAM